MLRYDDPLISLVLRYCPETQPRRVVTRRNAPTDPPERAGAKATWTSPTTGAAGGSGQLLVIAVGQAERDSLLVNHAGRSRAEPDLASPAR
jgi:hypothetical protein